MKPIYSSASKKLALKFILDNIDYRKRCQYLQEIIFLGKMDKVWQNFLNAYLSKGIFKQDSLVAFSKN